MKRMDALKYYEEHGWKWTEDGTMWQLFFIDLLGHCNTSDKLNDLTYTLADSNIDWWYDVKHHFIEEAI